MRYFKQNDRIYAFTQDQEHLIEIGMIELTDNEIDRHVNPLQYLTNKEKALLKRQQMPPLTKRQFNFYLRDIGVLDQVKQMLAQDLDAQLEYESVFEIYRDNPTVTHMIQALNLTEEQVDQMWNEAIKL